MCAVSVISDWATKNIDFSYPIPFRTHKLLRDMVRVVEELDKETGQPDCGHKELTDLLDAQPYK